MAFISISPELFLKLYLPVKAMCAQAIGEIRANLSIISWQYVYSFCVVNEECAHVIFNEVLFYAPRGSDMNFCCVQSFLAQELQKGKRQGVTPYRCPELENTVPGNNISSSDSVTQVSSVVKTLARVGLFATITDGTHVPPRMNLGRITSPPPPPPKKALR